MTTERASITLFACIAVLSLILLAETTVFGFMSDDFVLLQRVRTEGFFLSWGGEDGNSFFRPVTVLSYFTDNWIWGISSFGYHLTNLLWHLICSSLVFILGQRLFHHRERALAASVLFLVLSSHSESVSWISGRTDLIATAFSLASIVLFLKGSLWALPTCMLAFFAKESAVVTPFIMMLLLMDAELGNGKSKRIALAGLFLMVLYVLLRIHISADMFKEMELSGSDMSLLSVPENLFRYSFRVFIPSLPNTLRPYIESHRAVLPALFTAAVAVMGSLFLRKVNREGRKRIAVLIFCFLVGLLPVALMKVSLFDSRSERLLYLPGVFATLSLTFWVYSLFSRVTARTILLILCLIHGVFLYRSNRNWKRAGEICLESIESGNGERLDNHNGAYVFRNGFEEALLIYAD